MPLNDESVSRKELLNLLGNFLFDNPQAKRFLINEVNAIESLSECEQQFLATCLKIYRRWNGDVSPVENLIVSDLIGWYEHTDGKVTPSDIQDAVEDFRQYFNDHIEHAREAVRRFPELVQRNGNESGPLRPTKTKAPAGEIDPHGATIDDCFESASSSVYTDTPTPKPRHKGARNGGGN
jgi:hypothetical protein